MSYSQSSAPAMYRAASGERPSMRLLRAMMALSEGWFREEDGDTVAGLLPLSR